jgi:UPF0755 protein
MPPISSTPRPAALKRISAGVLCLFLLCLIVGYAESQPPRAFPSNVSVTIEQGMTLSGAADMLAENRLIRSAFLFKAYAVLTGKGTTGLKSGQYLFLDPAPSYEIASRLMNGIGGFPIAKVTIPEGVDTSDISAIIARQIPGFATSTFMAVARPNEGYLFPETYFWPANIQPAQVISIMRQQFKEEVSTTSVAEALASSSRSLDDIVKMAAILEREASSTEDRRIIAGILWKRLDAGIPLQVDAPFEYFLHKPSTQLTLADLAVKSPYNLYINKGLGPTPIANPGLDAILDAANPTATKYWYYLSDKHGVLHYAATLEAHAANKNRYLQ